MRKYITTVCFVLLAVFVSCSGSDDTEKKTTLKKGNYSFMFTDSSRNSLVEGQMKVDTINYDSQLSQYIVTGTYTVSKANSDTSYYAFSTLNPGPFKGYYDDKKKLININTNPRIADANVFVNANVTASGLEGGWYYSTFRSGKTEGGLFTASKLK